MKFRILSKQSLLIIVLVGCNLFLVIFSGFFSKIGSAIIIENITTIPAEEPFIAVQERPSYGLPVRLKIPTIDVDSVVEYVGLAPDGTMGVPKERANVAWFNLGSRPGENGSAVISGHYGWENNKGSVFDNLYKLRKGDKIYVEDERGEIASFVVRESQRYDSENKKTDGAEVFGSYDGKPHLNLITCEGVWDEKTQQYTKRLVVFTDKEAEINET